MIIVKCSENSDKRDEKVMKTREKGRSREDVGVVRVWGRFGVVIDDLDDKFESVRGGEEC